MRSAKRTDSRDARGLLERRYHASAHAWYPPRMTKLCVPANWNRARRDAEMYRLAMQGVPWAQRQFGNASGVGSPAEWVLRMAQAPPFVPDPASCSTDFYKSPDVTWREGGDCDDLVILGLTLAKIRNVPARIGYLPVPGAPQDHMFLWLWHNNAWQPAEVSLRGARLGEPPLDAAKRLGIAVPTGEAPVKATGALSDIRDGVISNILTVLIFGTAAYLGAKAGAREFRNPFGSDLDPFGLGSRKKETFANPFSPAQAAHAMHRAGIRKLPRGVTKRELAHGMAHEAAEHGDVTHGDARISARIALAHLREDPRYYQKLAAMERNPVPVGVEETPFSLETSHGEPWYGIAWDEPGRAFVLEQHGKDTRFRRGKTEQGQWFDDPEEEVWKDTRPGETLRTSDQTLRRLGISDFGVLQQMQERWNELHPSRNPFAGFKDFAACKRTATRRGATDPAAYCGAIENRIRQARAQRRAK